MTRRTVLRQLVRRLLGVELELAQVREDLADLVRAIETLTRTTVRTGDTLMDIDNDLADLQTAVDSQTDVVTGAALLLDQLASRLDAAADDPEQVRALAAEVRGNTSALAEAVARNTPADTGTGETPAPTEGETPEAVDADGNPVDPATGAPLT